MLRKNILESDVLHALAKCWLLTLSNGQQIGFTDHDSDLVINSICYHSNGSEISIVAQSADNESDNFEVKSVINNEQVQISDVLSGLYDNAQIEMFMVNYNALDRKYWCKKGCITDIVIQGQVITANVVGLTAAFEKNICHIYSENCRAIFSDKQCKVDSSRYQLELKIKELKGGIHLALYEPLKQVQYYTFGKVRFHSEKKQKVEIGIAHISESQITLMSKVPFEVHHNAVVELFPGCNKAFETCCSLYDNAYNFRGEPHLPSLSDILQQFDDLR